MASSKRRNLALFVGGLIGVSLCPSFAFAQQAAQGFAVERFYPSAPGGGWFVMDALDMRGSLGGAVELTTGYAHDPLRVGTGAGRLNVVADDAFADVGLAATYDRFRVYLNVMSPLLITGDSGTVGGYAFTAPNVDPSSHPDILSDLRLGFDTRLFGDAASPFRLGVGAQLMVPTGSEGAPLSPRIDYDTDNTYRAMLRILAAGDIGKFTYAGQIGEHIRPYNDSLAPGSPQGDELLFGVAGGVRLPVLDHQQAAIILGAEVYGASAFRSLFSRSGTALEGLLSARVEGTGGDGPQIRVKLGVGAGLNPEFGAPEWRALLAVELFDHGSDRDHDGVTDSVDACPDVPGVRTKDPRTNGCPIEREREESDEVPPRGK